MVFNQLMSITEPIDDLIFNLGEREIVSDNIVPPLERDPLLIELSRFADEMRARRTTVRSQQLATAQPQIQLRR